LSAWPDWELCPTYQECYTVAISCTDPDETVEFRNQPSEDNPNRTPGYWFTHPDSLLYALQQEGCDYITGGEFDLTINGGCCTVNACAANRIFWKPRGHEMPGPNIRRTLGMHIIAAMCNVCVFGTTPDPPGIIEAAIPVFCDPTAEGWEIALVLEPLDDWNNSGTTEELPPALEGVSADPNCARAMARGNMCDGTSCDECIDCWGGCD